MIYRVERVRDGRGFSTRRVVATQDHLPIFHLECAFHCGEPGLRHQEPAPHSVPPPDGLLNLAQVAAMMQDSSIDAAIEDLGYFRLVETRPIDPEQLLLRKRSTRRQFGCA